MENRAHALAAGLFALFLGSALVAALWWFSAGGEATRSYVLVTRGSVTGLGIQSQVRYRGMPAGKVTDIHIDPEDPRNILVDIAVREDLPINQSTRATLGYQGVTGLAFVQLDTKRGDAAPLAAADGQRSRIELQPGAMDQLTDTALQTVERLRVVADQLAAVFNEQNVGRLSATLERLQSAAGGIDRTFNEAPAAVASLRAAVASFQAAFSDENVARLSTALAGLEKASDQAGPAMAEVRELVARLDSLAAQLDHAAGEATPGLVENTLPQLNKLLQELTVTSRRMGRLIGEVDATPQLLLLGRGKRPPGPGEEGFEPKAH